jgi:hypothetical protein
MEEKVLSRKLSALAIVMALGLTMFAQTDLLSFTTWWSPFGNSYLPAELYAHTNLDDECNNYGAFLRGANAWNRVNCSNFNFVAGGIVTRSAPLNDDYQVVKWTNSCDPGVLATTYLLTNGPNRECDVLMCRDWNWNCGPGSTGWTQIDLQSVACHEFGHVLGLGHTSISAATMYYSISYGNDTKRSLHQDDKNGICYLY